MPTSRFATLKAFDEMGHATEPASGPVQPALKEWWIGRSLSTIALLTLILMSGCLGSKEESATATTDGPSHPGATVGHYSLKEVTALEAAVRQIRFPAPEESVSKLLGPEHEAESVAFFDFFRKDEKGRIGGRIQDYWLNHDYILRVAQAYYYVDDKPESKDEWAVILKAKDRGVYKRTPFE